MSRKLRESFVGHPDAILFLRISRKGVFQQPRLFAPTIPIVGWFRESCCRNESSATSCVFVRMQEWRYVESAEMVNQHDGLFPLIASATRASTRTAITIAHRPTPAAPNSVPPLMLPPRR